MKQVSDLPLIGYYKPCTTEQALISTVYIRAAVSNYKLTSFFLTDCRINSIRPDSTPQALAAHYDTWTITSKRGEHLAIWPRIPLGHANCYCLCTTCLL